MAAVVGFSREKCNWEHARSSPENLLALSNPAELNAFLRAQKQTAKIVIKCGSNIEETKGKTRVFLDLI